MYKWRAQYTANVYVKLRGVYGEIHVQGFQNYRVYMLPAFPIDSVGVMFMDFAGKLSYMYVVQNHMLIWQINPTIIAILIESKICMQYNTDNVGLTHKNCGESQY